MNSKSIGALSVWYSNVSSGGGKIAIAMAKGNIVDILQVMGLTQFITCYMTSEEAKLGMTV